jgi:orotidine-5'-phosphate decarboxylase
VSDLFLNLRLLGSPKETWQCVMEAAKLGARAISVSSLASVKNLKYAVQAAESSRATTLKVKRPLVFSSVLPVSISDAEMVDQLRMRVRRPGHVEAAARAVVEAGADGIVVEYEDVRYVRRVSKEIPLLVFAQRRVRNYAEVDREDERGKAGITEIMDAGASHVIFDSELVRRTDIEWAADMINKELDATTRR